MSEELIISQWLGLLQGLSHKALSLCAWFLIALVAIAPLEKLFPLRKQQLFRKDFLADVLYFFISGLLPAFALIVINDIVVLVFQSVLSPQWFTQVQSAPLWFRIIAIVIVSDFGFYWGHRWMHENPFLWRIHCVHHSPTQVDWLVATRAHPLEIVFLRTCSFIPMLAMGLVDLSPGRAEIYALLLVVINTFWGIFIHANVRLRFGWLEHLIATPHFHHWHHANDSKQVINKNYAALLPVYDRLFGTLHQPKKNYPSVYGIGTYLPGNFLMQLVFPLVWLFSKNKH
jgi:sterol desaturase/sphingolipid hydroxylase (fatty acid hydroxylase superfamily)